MKEIESVMMTREVKVFLKLIVDQFGGYPEWFDHAVFVRRKERVCLLSRDIDNISVKNIRINSLGLYIAEVKNDTLRLSIEGAQLIGPFAKKNICEVNQEQMREWFKGNDVVISDKFDGFVIMKCGSDFIGSGRFKDDHIINFVPKARRIMEMH